MSGFVPVPDIAIESVDVQHYGAVLDLYKRARALRWKPFRVTERSLASRWRISGRQVWLLLEALEMAGLLKLTKGSNRTPSTIEVLCPVRHNGQRTGQRTGQQNEKGINVDISESDAQGEAQTEAQGDETLTRDLDEESRGELFRMTADEEEAPTDLQQAVARWEGLWAERREVAKRAAPKGGKLSKAATRVLAEALKTLSLEEVLLLADWAFVSPDYAGPRGDVPINGEINKPNEYLHPINVYRKKKLPAKLHRASLWDEDGRPTLSGKPDKIDVWGIITSKLSTYSPSDPGWRWCEDERLHRAIHAGLYRWEYEGPPALLRVDASWRHKHREAILAAVRTEYRGGGA